MDYKKKYNKIVDAVKVLRDNNPSDKGIQNWVNDNVPELKESKGEKIRNLCEELVRTCFMNELCTKEDKDDCIAWLEKQGEVDNLHNYLYGERNVFYKVGDWVIRSTEGFKHNIYLVTEVKDYYVCEDLKGRRVTFTFNDVHKNFRLWNISDAKDGDVLVDEDNNIGIYRGEKDNFWESYIYLGCNNYLYGFSIGGYHEHKNTKPATKEQRDLLFKKIKESGHEWDTEKKELNKIESKFKVGDWVVRGDVVAQILDVQEQYYVGIDTNGNDFTSSRFSSDDKIHLWTIQEAKDGDVLCDGIDTVIYKKNIYDMVRRSMFVHCGINNRTEYWFEVGGISPIDYLPATKEQRDILFTKMKEAGYEWDDEKKELRVIDWGKHIKYEPNSPSITEEPWRYEDEENLNQLHKLIVKKAYEEYEIDTEDETLWGKHAILDNWLKSLKERIKGGH